MGFIFEDVDGSASGPENDEPGMESQQDYYQEDPYEDYEEDTGKGSRKGGRKGYQGRLKFRGQGSFRDRLKRARERERGDYNQDKGKGKRRGGRRNMEDRRSSGKGKQRTESNC